MTKKPAKIVEEHLSRAKAAYLKGDPLRPLLFTAEALKVLATAQIHSMEFGRIGTMLRENLANLHKMERVKKLHPDAFVYAKGKEKQVLGALVPLVKKIKDELDAESMEEMRKRKLAIDKAILSGQRMLDAGKVAEAQQGFREAVEMHVDEDAMFLIIPEKLQAAGAYGESLEYLRRALEIDPASRKACEMAGDAFEKLKDPDRGMAFFNRVKDKNGSNPHLLMGLARVQAVAKDYKAALATMAEVLGADPELVQARKLAGVIKRRATMAAKKKKA